MDNLNHQLHLKKKTKCIIIHIGTNDATTSTSGEILDKTLKRKILIKERFHETGVAFSTPTTKLDDGKAALTVITLCDHLVALNMKTKETSLVNTWIVRGLI